MKDQDRDKMTDGDKIVCAAVLSLAGLFFTFLAFVVFPAVNS